MALGKMLNLGGIDNRPPKANQSNGKFRVARNVYPTPDGRIIPRYTTSESLDQPTNVKCVHNISQYDNDYISLVSADPYSFSALDYHFYRNIPDSGGWSKIPLSSGTGLSPWQFLECEYAQSVMSFRRNNTTYYLCPFYGDFLKYDGVEASYAGCHQPIINATYSTATTGLKYVRVVQHKIDFDNNEPWSEYVQFPILATTLTLPLRTDGGANIIDGSQYVSPKGKVVPKTASDIYFKNGVCTYNVGTDDLTIQQAANRTGVLNGTITVTGISSTADLRVGMQVQGSSGIPANCFIASIVSGTSITLTVAATTSATVTLFFPIDNGIFYSGNQGAYVIVFNSLFTGATYGLQNGFALALKVKSVLSVSSFKLDLKDAYYLDTNREWIKSDITAGKATLATQITEGTRNFLSIWASASATGVYNFQGFTNAFPSSSILKSVDIAIANPPVIVAGSDTKVSTLGPILNDIYDTNTRKLNLNTFYPFGGWMTLTSMAVYQDLLLVANDDLIWFSDTTLGGSFEQFNTSNFIRVGDKEYGRITSICGSNDFFIVCRERKNYYVNGNIATGNYRVQEITAAEVGAWSNSSSILIKDMVYFINPLGVFQVSDGGRCVKVSEFCPKNFDNYDAVNVNEDVTFRLTGFTAMPTKPETPFVEFVDDGLSLAFDEYRELLVFMKKGQGNPTLVLHTKTGEFYEWNGLMADESRIANCITFIRSEFYLGEVNEFSGPMNSKILEEDKTLALNYAEVYPIKLYSTWLTAGEPSLEKNLLQLKLFGRVDPNSTSSKTINVCHYKDWNISSKITNSPYFPIDTTSSLNFQTQYSHKKRLNSDKVQSASVGFEVNDSGVTFELEAMEVEFSSIQEGMKK